MSRGSAKTVPFGRGVLLAAVLVLLACVAAAAPRPPVFHWTNYTPANGFPPGEVFCVTVDGQRVWAGTKHGLVLLEDGAVRKVFTRADGLPGTDVMSVAVDKQTGDVWIGTLGGLSRYSGGHFQNYTNLSSGLANDLVYSVGVQSPFVWVATGAGVNRFDTSTGEWTIFNEKNAPFAEPWAYSISFGKDTVYMGVWGGGVIVYNTVTRGWRPYSDPDGEMDVVLYRNQGLIHEVVSSVSYNPDTGMFWASTYFGLSGYDGRNWHNYLAKDSGLASNFVNVVQSRGDAVWACTDKGLSYFDYRSDRWATYRKNPGSRGGEIVITEPGGKKSSIATPTSLAHDYVLNVALGAQDIWVATAEGLSHGVIEFSKEERSIESAAYSRH